MAVLDEVGVEGEGGYAQACASSLGAILKVVDAKCADLFSRRVKLGRSRGLRGRVGVARVGRMVMGVAVRLTKCWTEMWVRRRTVTFFKQRALSERDGVPETAIDCWCEMRRASIYILIVC